MFELLQSHSDWDNPSTPLLGYATFEDEDEDEEEVSKSTEVYAELLQEANASQDDKDVASGISDLLAGGMINKEEHESYIKQLSNDYHLKTLYLYMKNLQNKAHDLSLNIVHLLKYKKVARNCL